ncbi:2-phospho-L-lactate guanylyltransferase [Halomarina halobia]|uniref:2-phospho-L-lactate guanylyltransferase n=1 Tax=Halomarina halobia TaxID=3033386 RepID=A0ABD6A9G1_9EURY|nr:2-phospho-L-lactate guanylyltransferase [Halomarina sp. PSR21]
MRVVVPYRVRDPKTRLAPVLDPEERVAFSRAMLDDVLAAVWGAGRVPEVLATEPLDADLPDPVAVDARPLTDAVNAVLDAAGEPVAVVAADLALATPAALARLFDAAGEVVLAPGRGGGTNALLARHPQFRVDYHGASYRDHLSACETIGAHPVTVDSYRLGTDVDEPADLVEVLLHGEGVAGEWLRDRGFVLAVDGGRVGVRREGE